MHTLLNAHDTCAKSGENCMLTHWGQVTHIGVIKNTNIASDNGLSPVGAKPFSESILPYCQLGPEEHISINVLSEIRKFSFKKIHLNRSSAKWQPFCLDLNVMK